MTVPWPEPEWSTTTTRSSQTASPTELGDALRGHLARNTISVDDYFSLFERLHRDHGSDPNGRTRVLLSPANVQWADDGFLERTKEYAT